MTNDNEKLARMETGASLGKNGKGTIAGQLVQFKSHWNHGTSGKGKTTFWYVNGTRTSLAEVRRLLKQGPHTEKSRA